MKKALILVDIQNDFCKGGALEVPDANLIIPFVNDLMNKGSFDLVVATQDFHPRNHGSFASNNNMDVGTMGELGGIPQVMWPDHCIEGTKGVEFHEDLNMDNVDKVFKKGQNPEIDSYSGFYDNDKKTSTGLAEYLKEKEIEEVFVVGLALDYCVKYTALDANKEGFKTVLLLDGTRAVNLNEKDGENSIIEMIEEGIECR